MTQQDPEPGVVPHEGADGPQQQGTSGAGEGGADVGDATAPAGFGATVGGAPPGATSDPEEAKEFENAPGGSKPPSSRPDADS